MAGCQICHPIPSLASGYCPTMVGLQILRQPRPCRLAEGDTLTLECRAIGNPPPQYQWFRNRRPVEGAQASQLQVWRDPRRGMARHGVARCGMPPQLPTPSRWQVKLVTTDERGSYSCRVFNLFHEVWSREVDVEIGEGPGQTSMAPIPRVLTLLCPPPKALLWLPHGFGGSSLCRQVLLCRGSLTPSLLQARGSLPLEVPGRRGMEVGGGRVGRSLLLCPLRSLGTTGLWHGVPLFLGSPEQNSPGQLYGKRLPRRGWWLCGAVTVPSVPSVTP